METRTFNFNQTTFHYDVAGNGEPIVFIHAGICDRRMWTPQMEGLAEQFHLHRYDLRGYGETAVADTTYSHLDDLKALLDHWQLDSVHLIGCSKGGSISLDFALEYPDRVKSITMVCSNPSGFKFTGEIPPLWHEIVAAFEAKEVEKTIELEIQFWVDGWQYRPAGSAPEHVRELVREMDRIVMLNELKGLGKERPLDTNATERLEQVRQPVLLIVGRFDDDDIEQANDFMLTKLPSAQKHILDTAHLPNMEQPDQFNQLLSQFLSQQKKPGLLK